MKLNLLADKHYVSRIFRAAIYHLHGSVVIKIRSYIYKKALKSCGKSPRFFENCTIRHPENIFIGDDFYMGPGGKMIASGGVIIGDHVMFGPNVVILTNNHFYGRVDIPMDAQETIYKKVIIGNVVWIGGGAIIVPGVHIGNGCVIGAGSVVTKDIPEWSVAVGNPARVIK